MMGITANCWQCLLCWVYFVRCGIYTAELETLRHFSKDTLEDQAIQEFARRVDELSKGRNKNKGFPRDAAWRLDCHAAARFDGEGAGNGNPAGQLAGKTDFFPLFFPACSRMREMLRETSQAPDISLFQKGRLTSFSLAGTYIPQHIAAAVFGGMKAQRDAK